MQKFIKNIFYSLIALVYALPALAQDSVLEEDLGNEIGRQADAFRIGIGLAPTSFGGIVATVIQIFLGLTGMVFVSLIFYAGWIWMTARGNEERVAKAQDIFKSAIWGLGFTLGAYAISYFVLRALSLGVGGLPEFGGPAAG